MLTHGSAIDLSRRLSNHLLHVYSPETPDEDGQILCEIEVFVREYGLEACHTTLRPHSAAELTAAVRKQAEDLVQSRRLTTLTVVLWGHGNKIDERQGFYKVFSGGGGAFEFYMLDNLLNDLHTLAEHLGLVVQALMTQCWAHCHDQARFGGSSRLRVAWLTSDDSPETTARRWSRIDSAEEIRREEMEEFMSHENNYDRLYSRTVDKYTSVQRRVFLKYLHYSSIHVEAMRYLVEQRTGMY